ncbi:HHL1-like protein [Pantanalinema sp. GBBB05]|uniref:HHL1-like protein n=1 Tax=Pantanalinema sp. GBBB05 TaxID=2604139 RepID=UPI001E0A4815|nr:hypothetical protein [Pantanalinema sp. GBBB05]
MTTHSGFGKPKATKQPSKQSAKRSDAAKQYDKMKADGLPEFTIFIRIQGKNNWYPVGSIAVARSNQINHAIFDQEAELLQGALRLFPILRKHQNQLEYGYRLKQFNDEPIQLATKPAAAAGNLIQSSLNQVKDRLSGLFQRK